MMTDKKYWIGFKECPLQEHQREIFWVDVHGCGHIMRILQGLNEKGKCYILWSSDVHQKRVKMAGNWAEMVRLDKMSRRDWGREEKSLRLDILSKREKAGGFDGIKERN